MLMFHLPNQFALASEYLRQHDLVIIGIDVELGSSRDQARSQIRQALMQVIAATWNVRECEIQLHTEKGQAPYVVISDQSSQRIVYLSITHEAPYAFAVISGTHPVGIDLVSSAEYFDWKDTAFLYLGSAITQEIEAHPISEQFVYFLRAWASHEARLKCLGLGLQEWSQELERRLQSVESEVGYVSWNATYIAAFARL